MKNFPSKKSQITVQIFLFFFVCNFLLTSCSEKYSSASKTMKNFIDISNSMAGSVTVDIKIKECCVQRYKEESSKADLDDRYVNWGLVFAPFAYLEAKEGFKLEEIKFISAKEVSPNKILATFGTKSHEIVGPMELENGKWLFTMGNVKVFKIQNGKKTLIPTEVYRDY